MKSRVIIILVSRMLGGLSLGAFKRLDRQSEHMEEPDGSLHVDGGMTADQEFMEEFVSPCFVVVRKFPELLHSNRIC